MAPQKKGTKQAPVFVAGQHKRNTAALIKALESGKFTHATDALEKREYGDAVGNCCLGVVCRLAKFKVHEYGDHTDFVFPNEVIGGERIADGGWWRSMFGRLPQDKLIHENDGSHTGYAPVIKHLKAVNARRK